MTKTILMAVLLVGTALASNASAATSGTGTYFLNYGNVGNPTPYGTVTVTSIDGTNSVSVSETVFPNFIIDNGNAGVLAALTFNLNGTGKIRASTVTDPYSISTTSPVTNPPFGSFTSAIAGDCGSGASSGGCGSTLEFIIDNFQGFNSNDFTFNGTSTLIYFATDIFNAATRQTGAVGAGMLETPIPPALALFLSGLVGIGMLRRVSKRKGEAVALNEAAVS